MSSAIEMEKYNTIHYLACSDDDGGGGGGSGGGGGGGGGDVDGDGVCGLGTSDVRTVEQCRRFLPAV